jgi:hypothetical protein
MQTAAPDKLLNPPRCGGKLKWKSGFRSAERCLRSLSRRIPANPMKFPEGDMVFISKSDRLRGRLEACATLVGPAGRPVNAPTDKSGGLPRVIAGRFSPRRGAARLRPYIRINL